MRQEAECDVCERVTRRWGYALYDIDPGETRILCVWCAFNMNEPLSFDDPPKGSKSRIYSEDEIEEIKAQAREEQKQQREIIESISIERFYRDGPEMKKPVEMPAKFNGRCIVCRGKIWTEQPIFFLAGKGAWHVNCWGGKTKVEYVEEAQEEPKTMTGRKFRPPVK